MIHSPVYIYKPETKKTYERQIDDSFKELDDYDVKTEKQFDLIVDSSNIIGSGFFKYLTVYVEITPG